MISHIFMSDFCLQNLFSQISQSIFLNVHIVYLQKDFMVAQTIMNPPAILETQVYPWIGKFPWRREWHPTLVFLPGELHGQWRWRLAGYSPWGHKESDMTERLTLRDLNLLISG